MSRLAATRFGTVTLALHLTFGVASAQPTRIGTEFQVNAYTAGDEDTNRESVAVEDNGDFVVVWESSSAQDGSVEGVFARRFASTGAVLGSEFQVNMYTSGAQSGPVIAADADGDFVVAWSSNQDGDSYGVFARRFSSSGAALAPEFQVNTYTIGAQALPTLARDADGDFVITWLSVGQDGSGVGVFARRWNAAGVAQAVEFQVTAFTDGTQQLPVIDTESNGDFVIVWQSSNQDGDSYGVFGQRFGSGGNKLGSELQINQTFTGNQSFPALAVDADGEFMVAWVSDQNTGGIFARRFDSSGAPQGGEMQVNVYASATEFLPTMAADADGDFVVTWSSNGQDGSGTGVFARHFKNGAPTGGDIPVNSTVAGAQQANSVGADADGDFVVVWTSALQDGAGYGVIGQRFNVTALLDIDGNSALGALTDGILVLRFLFGFTGTALTAGAVGPNCTRCDSTTILPHLQSLT